MNFGKAVIEKAGVELENLLKLVSTQPEQWSAFYFQPPENFHALSGNVWVKPEFLKLASQQLDVAFMDSDRFHFFLFPDHSVLALFKGAERLRNVDMAAKTYQILFSVVPLQAQPMFKLDENWGTFVEIAKKKIALSKEFEIRKEASLIAAKSPEKPKLDSSALLTEDFKIRCADKTQFDQDRLRILVVDDDAVTLGLLNSFLKNFQPIQASSGKQAIQKYYESVPHVMFLDIGLPDCSGLDVLQAVAQNDPKAFVVMLTANSSEKNLMDALKGGAKGFIAKPFTYSKLEAYIEKYKAS